MAAPIDASHRARPRHPHRDAGTEQPIAAAWGLLVDVRVPLTYHIFEMFPFMSCSLPPARRAAPQVSRATSPALRRFCLRSLLLTGLVTVSLTPAFTGCATSDEGGRPVNYSYTAKQNYEKGLAELKDENYPEAQKFFQYVRSKYPFSKYAVLAELAIADTEFDRANYTEAIDSYKQFIRLHPTHEKVTDGYAAYRVGECYYKDMPDDVWLLPPSYEKDQSAVGDALREIDEFVKKYPDSPYVKEAQPLRREALKRLVDHEVYVARFYLDRDHPKAAAMRIEGAIRRYPGSGREPELLVTLAQTYLHMGDPARARDTFERVVREYRAAPQARQSELYLDFIKDHYGDHPASAAFPAGIPGGAPVGAPGAGHG